MPRIKIKMKHPNRQLRLRVLGFLALVLVLGVSFWFLLNPRETLIAEDVVLISQALAPVTFPQDKGPHQVRTEWWYYNGHLRTLDGQRFSYHYTLFAHRAFAQHSIVHASLLDHQTMQTFYYEKRIPGLAVQAQAGEFILGTAPWQVQLLSNHDILTGETAEFSLQLQLDNQGPLVLQEPDAVLDFKSAGTSYYYSRSRMASQGSLTIGEQTYSVSGQSWFDHQWGEFRATVMNWDWFALQLDNGADVMLYTLTDAQGAYVYSGGTYFKDGETYFLTADNFTATPGRAWTSPATGYNYPVEWTLTIPSKNLDLSLQAVKDASEFNALKSTYSAYWEGPVEITGTHGGLGFVEVSKANTTD